MRGQRVFDRVDLTRGDAAPLAEVVVGVGDGDEPATGSEHAGDLGQFVPPVGPVIAGSAADLQDAPRRTLGDGVDGCILHEWPVQVGPGGEPAREESMLGLVLPRNRVALARA